MTTTELNQNAFPYILSAIDGEGYEKTFLSDAEKLQFLADTYRSEYGYPENIKYYGSDIKCFTNWLQGLPSCFNVDFENYRIIEIAKQWGSIPHDATDKQEDKILANWFNLIANKTFQLMKRNGVKL